MPPCWNPGNGVKSSAVIGRDWVSMEMAIELLFPSPTAVPCSLFAFVKAGRGQSLLYRICISQLQIIAAGVSDLLLQDMWQLQAFTHYYSNINSSAMTRFYPTWGHFCYKRKCMWLTFCSLVPLLHLSLFLWYGETASSGLPSIWDFLEMVALLARGSACLEDMFLWAQETPRTAVDAWPRQWACGSGCPGSQGMAFPWSK